MWASANSANAVTILSGTLSGTGDLTLGAGSASNNTTLPNLRFTGANNSGYTGTISTVGSDSFGVLLDSAGAMTGGLINLDNGNRNLWLTGGAGSGTYAFGIAGGGADVSGGRGLFRSAGTSACISRAAMFMEPRRRGRTCGSGTVSTTTDRL